MTGGAVSFWFFEIVDVHITRVLPCDYFIPLDCFDVAEVVVVQNPDRATQDI